MSKRTISYVTGLDCCGDAAPSHDDQVSFLEYVEFRVGKMFPGARVNAEVDERVLASSVTSDDDTIDCDSLCSLIGNEIWSDWCGGERAPVEGE